MSGMMVHLFRSLGCANYGTKNLARQNEGEYSVAVSFIRKNLYVDDGLISPESIDKAINLVEEAQFFVLKDSCGFFESICATERITEVKGTNNNTNDLPIQKVLRVRQVLVDE